MASSHNTRNRVRLRIAEIELQPTVLKRAVKAELTVGGKTISALPTIEGGQTLKWSNLIICDTYSTAHIELVVYSRQLRIFSRHESESCLVSEVVESPIKTLTIKIDNIQCTVKIRTPDRMQVEESFAKRCEKLADMEQISNIPDKLKSTQRMFKSMLEFGSAVAELNPIAKTVFAVCTCAWEKVEEQQKLSEDLADLAGKLVGIALLVDEVKKYARLAPLQQNIEEFLYLIEDVSIFALEDEAKGFVVQAFKSVFDSTHRDRVEELGKRFQKTKGEFDAAIGVQTMAMVATAGERELLKQLNPVEPSGHDPSRVCQNGTRLRILSDIGDWIQDPNPSSTFMWVYGQAGIGKSTIAASICNRLSDRGIPVVSFFCKRDDPALRDPLRLINSIAHGLAYRYPPYGKLVAKAIEANPELCTSHIGVRYEGLLKKPLTELKRIPLPPPHFMLIDAMDESGIEETRRQLLGYLRELSLLVPWVRIIVTSRPDNDIRSFFDQPATTPISRRDLQTYPAANDIRLYIQAQVINVAIEDGWPADGIDRLCAKAGELFIWAATACKFILKADDSLGRLRQLLGGSGSSGGFDGLDSLYKAVIENSMADQATDSVLNMRRCIGAIVKISMNQPVPIEVLCELMRVYIEPRVLRKVVGRLGAVLYSDTQLEGAIRVLHPSFADFALDKTRSGDFWVDPLQRNIEISVGCIYTMEKELRFNICELETSHRLNSQVPDLKSKVQANISGQLAYSCIYWISHLVESNDTAAVGRVANIINGPRLLYWLEVLSVLRRVDVAVQGLRELSQRRTPSLRTISHYIWDAYRFVFAFYDPIMASAPHIYVSALALVPRESEISRTLIPFFPNLATPLDGADVMWPGWLRSIPQPAKVRSMCIARGSQRMVTSCHEQLGDDPAHISIFDLRTGELLKILKLPPIDHQSHFAVISPNGALIASGSPVGEVLFWDANTGDMINRIQIERSKHETILFRAWTFSPDGTTLHLLGVTRIRFSDVVKIWVIRPNLKERGTNVVRLPQEESTPIAAAAFSPNGDNVAIGYATGRVVITPLFNLARATQFITQYSPNLIVFSPDETLLAVASTSTSSHFTKGALQMWNTRKGEFQGKPIWCSGRILSIAFSSDGSRMITSNSDRTLQIWNPQTDAIGCPFLRLSHSVTFLAFSPDGAYVLSGSDEDAVVRMWDVSQHSTIDTSDQSYTHKQKCSGHSSRVGSVMFSPDGSRIVSGSNDCTVRTWDSQTGVPLGEHRHLDSEIKSVRVSSDNTRTLAMTTSRTLYIWDTQTSREVFIQRDIYSFALSPNGSHLVTSVENYHHFTTEMALWDINTGRLIKRILSPGQSHPIFIAFSLNGSRMFTHHRSISSSLLKPNDQPHSSLIRIHEQAGFSVDWNPNYPSQSQSSQPDYLPSSARMPSCPSQSQSSQPYYLPSSARVPSCPSQSQNLQPIYQSSGPQAQIYTPAYPSQPYSLQPDYQPYGPRAHSYNPFYPSQSHSSQPRSQPLGSQVYAYNPTYPSQPHSSQPYCPPSDPQRYTNNQTQFLVHSNPNYQLRGFQIPVGDYSWIGFSGHLNPNDQPPTTLIDVAKDGVCIWETDTYGVVGRYAIDIQSDHHDRGYRRLYDDPKPRVHGVSPDGISLATSCGNKILVHDANTGRAIFEPPFLFLSTVNCIAFSPDGTHIASCHEGGVQLYNVGLNNLVKSWQFDERSASTVLSVAFSPNGTKLVAGFEDSSIRMWDVGVDVEAKPWINGNVSYWPSSTRHFPPHPKHPSWVSHDQQSLTLWLPDHYRSKYVPSTLLWISNEPKVYIDFSKFVHGTGWTLVISEKALRSCN